ncbi:MAG: transcriptional repressor [Desulfobacterales bacterium]|nr:transcriptional repressor [Desulfobacterales bacterium]
MCHLCNYEEILQDSGLEVNANRILILQIIGNSTKPLNAKEILEIISRTQNINSVTVYRILELLVEHKALEKISSGDRSFRFGLAPNKNHQHHPHFYCTKCGNMECLSPEVISINIDSFEKFFSGIIDKTELRLDGICINCLTSKK